MKVTPEEAIRLILTMPTVNVSVAAAAMGVSQPTASRLLNAGQFSVPAHRMGTRWVIPTPALRRFLQLDRATDPAAA